MDKFSSWFNQIPDDAPYVVIDKQTGKVVYRTTYKNRVRARRFADKKDIEYGAIRYIARLEESKINTMGKDIAISCNLVKKNAYNQTENNCVEIVNQLATKFGYKPLDFTELDRKILDYKGWRLYGKYGNPQPAWLNLRSMANVIVREDENKFGVYHVSFEFRGKEYNYGDIESPILFKIPLAKVNNNNV